MDHPEGAGLQRADRVDFDPRVRLEFRGTQLSSDGGLPMEPDLMMRFYNQRGTAERHIKKSKYAAKNVCSAGKFKQSRLQTARHSGNVGF
jgi:hypothetical protein